MGKHKYKHFSQIRPTCANPPAQSRYKYGKSSFSSTWLPCHPVQNAFLEFERNTLGISSFCWTEYGWCLQDRYKERHLCATSAFLLQYNTLHHLPVSTKGQGQKGVRYEVPVLCPVHLLVSLLDYTCWIISPSLLFTCLSVYKHKAEITSTLPFLLSLLFVFIHPHSVSQTPSILYRSSYWIPQSEQ